MRPIRMPEMGEKRSEKKGGRCDGIGGELKRLVEEDRR